MLCVKCMFQYNNCRQKFFKHDDVTVLQYLGLAYFKGGYLKEAKAIFSKVSSEVNCIKSY